MRDIILDQDMVYNGIKLPDGTMMPKTPTELVIPSEIDVDGEVCRVTTLDADVYAFSTITKVTIPDSVRLIENTAFAYCHFLESVYIPDSVTTIGNAAFFGDENLKEVSIPATATVWPNAFDGCSPDIKITIRKDESMTDMTQPMPPIGPVPPQPDEEPPITPSSQMNDAPADVPAPPAEASATASAKHAISAIIDDLALALSTVNEDEIAERRVLADPEKFIDLLVKNGYVPQLIQAMASAMSSPQP